MIGLNPDSCIGGMTLVDGMTTVNLCTPAWLFPDLRTLWLPGALNDQNLPVDDAQGDRPLTLVRTTVKHSLPFLISGEVNSSGTLASPFTMLGIQQQLETNLGYLTTHVLTPPGTSTDTRVWTLTLPSGATRTASVHVLGLTVVKAYARLLSTTLDISVANGKFT